VKDGKTGDYPDAFNTQGSHDLTRLARFESYRGFLFGSLSADVPAGGHLGATPRSSTRSSIRRPKASKCCAAVRPMF
jgi:phenylpropionate dioxygenase-like ring-hydroxylating dioxygenase large terminal subunit